MSTTDETYHLYYWPDIPGRGEYVRLALEAGGATYIDHSTDADAVATLLSLMQSGSDTETPSSKSMAPTDPPVFAPPILRHGELWISQTPNILLYLATKLDLLPAHGEAWHANQIQLTLSDMANELHDSHHPIAVSAYYEDQREAAMARAKDVRETRVPKFLAYFERCVRGGSWLMGGDTFTYVDLSLFQNIEGLRFAMPRLMRQIEHKYPRVIAVHDRVRDLPVLKQYLAGRLPFGNGLFRHYEELDVPLA